MSARDDFALRKSLWGFLFALKVLLSLAISCGIYAFFIWNILELRKPENLPKKLVLPKPGSPECFTNLNGRGVLEPPAGSFMYGFHLDWSQVCLPRCCLARFSSSRRSLRKSFLRSMVQNLPSLTVSIRLTRTGIRNSTKVPIPSLGLLSSSNIN